MNRPIFHALPMHGSTTHLTQTFSIMHTLTLATGARMPTLGFGVFQIPPEATAQAVAQAITAGYRHIDTAQIYLNEQQTGQGIRDSGVPREDLFVTSKVWVSNAGHQQARASVERSLARLGLDHVDLMLIHRPFGDVYGTWRALQDLQAEGRIRTIGVSNFSNLQLVDLGTFNTTMPAVNQIEIHPFYPRHNLVRALQVEGVTVQAWAPFAEGKHDIFNHPVLSGIGVRHGKSVAQVIVRWLLERNIVVLAKTVHPERMAQNLDVFDFELSEDDHRAIATLDRGESLFNNHESPDEIRKLKTQVLNV